VVGTLKTKSTSRWGREVEVMARASAKSEAERDSDDPDS